MKLLILEDDEFKAEDIVALIQGSDEKYDIERHGNVRDAICSLKEGLPDKIVLDMSLPSHSPVMGDGTPLSLPTGGLEIILFLRRNSSPNFPVIILTQYPDIEINGEYYSIEESEKKISDYFGLNNVSVAHYLSDEYHDSNWRNEMKKFLRN